MKPLTKIFNERGNMFERVTTSKNVFDEISRINNLPPEEWDAFHTPLIKEVQERTEVKDVFNAMYQSEGNVSPALIEMVKSVIPVGRNGRINTAKDHFTMVYITDECNRILRSFYR